MRATSFCSLAVATLVLSGCTEMRIEGDARVFQSSAVGTIIQTIIGLGLLGLGIAAVAGGVLPDRKPRKRKSGVKRVKPKDQLSSRQRTGLLLFGGAMGFAGLFLAGVSFIFPNKLHVTVYPDRVAMASTYSQTGGKDIVVPFAGLTSVELRDERNVIGKLKTYLVFTRKNGKTIKQLAGNNERKAIDTIQQALAAFQPPASTVPQEVALDEPSQGERGKKVSRPRDANVAASRRGRSSPTPPAEASGNTDTTAASKKYSLKRYEINIPVPDGYSVVDASSDVKIGMKLGACYARRWETVTVVAINDDGTITCNWDKWRSFTYRMLREDLTIPD